MLLAGKRASAAATSSRRQQAPTRLAAPRASTPAPRGLTTTAAAPASAPTAPAAEPLVFSSTSTAAQASAASAAAAAAAITTHNAGGEVAVWSSVRPLCRLPASLDDPEALRAAARQLPGYEGWRGPQAEVLTASDGLPVDFASAERCLLALLQTPALDARLARFDATAGDAAAELRRAVEAATARAYGPQGDDGSPQAAACHTFLQRLLYRINRLNHFWYDDLSRYENERSPYCAALQDAAEGPWQRWEAAREGGVSGEAFKSMGVEELSEAVRSRAAVDVDPPASEVTLFLRDRLSLEGYRHLLAVGSLDGLVEASRQSRVCAGAPNPVSVMVFRVLMEEYGSGKLARKHSTFYASMMGQLDLDTRLEAYFDLLPWQWLAGANHNFLLTERRRHYLRYLGGLTFFEVNGPSVYRTYCAAARRLGLPPSAWGYWELHVREDERHGRQMVEEVAVPLMERYGPSAAWEVLWGYDQEVAMGRRAGEALVADILAAEAGAGAQ
ncbi:hypothetical protein HYH03_010266 [Edaphochlamys debaryana]|uniref:Iron-containing redox enzyme n=1 Tax=Edaphochlamys debaryana TaxID=47281 RepID=A0A835XXK2_9CHLO|nr:hypothetical protein HYH03_010266 [Edaphochlamys debaryana]|eukprot:KAG2491482.1 hypothetical protein HYH03_010266 [Edaphochlamys debaryana]